MKSNYKSIGELVERIDQRNTNGTVTNLIGVSIDKRFIPSVANVIGTDLTKYKVIEKYDFAVSLMQVSRDEKIPVACQTDFDRAIMSPAYPIFRVKDTNVILPEYLEMWFMRPEFDREASFIAVGGVRGSMPWDDFANMKLPVPSIMEQHEIVSGYKAITERIKLKKQINDNLQQQAQAIYSSMFIDNPDPAWSHGHLSDLITVKYGKDHKKLADGIYPVYGSGGIMRYVERPLYNKESVLIPRKGTLNNVMYVNQPFWSVDTMFYTEMKLPNVAKFVYHFVKAKDLASMNAGSAVPSMTTDILNAMEVIIPSASALEEFESLVAPMYEAMEANDVQSKALSQMRDTLLPKLMSGEIDVSDIQL